MLIVYALILSLAAFFACALGFLFCAWRESKWAHAERRRWAEWSMRFLAATAIAAVQCAVVAHVALAWLIARLS